MARKPPEDRPLNDNQKALVKNCVTQMATTGKINATKAYRETYECTESSAKSAGPMAIRKPNVALAIQRELDAAGATESKIARVISDAMDAETPEKLIIKGDTTTVIESSPDHNIRLKGADMASKLRDLYPKDNAPVGGNVMILVQQLSQYSFEDLSRIQQYEIDRVNSEE